MFDEFKGKGELLATMTSCHFYKWTFPSGQIVVITTDGNGGIINVSKNDALIDELENKR